jgi:transposase
MWGLGPATKVYLALGATDLRKGFDGLYGLVQFQLSCWVSGGNCSQPK